MAALAAARGAARRDEPRLQRAQQPARDRRRRAVSLRRARPVRQLPRRPARNARAAPTRPSAVALRAFVSHPRRLIEVLVDFAIICASFLASYLLFVDGNGHDCSGHVFLVTLPVLLAVRYVSLRPRSGSTAGSGALRARATCSRSAAAVAVSAPVTIAIVAKHGRFGDFPLEIFVVDALLCTRSSPARGSRCVLPPLAAARAEPRSSGPDRGRRPFRAAASPASCARRPETRVVGFVDDNPRLRRRRIHGVTVPRRPRRVEALLASRPARRGARDDPGRRAGAARRRRRRLCGGRRRCRFVRSEITPPPSLSAGSASDRDSRTSRERLSPGAARWLLSSPISCLAVALRLAGVAAGVADDLQRRDRIHADLARDRRDGHAARGSASRAASVALHVPGRPGLVARPTARVGAAKLIGVLVMTATIFPAYGLARFVVSRP